MPNKATITNDPEIMTHNKRFSKNLQALPMKDSQLRVIAGALLHDVGKLCHRNGAPGTHSESGWEYLRGTIGITDETVLNCVRYHH